MNLIVKHNTGGVEQFTVITDIYDVVPFTSNRNIYDGRVGAYLKTRFPKGWEYWSFEKFSTLNAL